MRSRPQSNKDEKNNGSPQVCGPWRGAWPAPPDMGEVLHVLFHILRVRFCLCSLVRRVADIQCPSNLHRHDVSELLAETGARHPSKNGRDGDNHLHVHKLLPRDHASKILHSPRNNVYLKSLVVYRPEHGGVQLLARETRTAALDEQGLERTYMAVRALCLPRHELYRVCPTQRGH